MGIADFVRSVPVGAGFTPKEADTFYRAHPTRDIKPQPGPQEQFLTTTADVAIYGGAAGGGKTWSLLMDPLRYTDISDFRAIIFRRTYPQITNPGGLWDESNNIYPYAGGRGTQSSVTWTFESGAKIQFKHMQHEKSKEEFQGAQIPFIGFDELTHFTRSMVFYMLSRNRYLGGVAPYVRGTCNPDANSWVKTLLAPWLDRTFTQPNGEIRRLNSAEIAYFSGKDGRFVWHTREELEWEIRKLKPEERTIKTITFIKASVFDNKELIAKNPQYIANLRSLPLVEQERFLHGNWDIVESGNMFRRDWFKEVIASEVPTRFRRLIRFWDFASTKPGEVEKGRKEEDPDYTAGALMGLGYNDKYYFLDLKLVRETPQAVEDLVLTTALYDYSTYGGNYEVWWEQEPGASGEFFTEHLKQVLAGFFTEGLKSTGSKIARAKPFSAEAQKGNMYMLIGPWNDDFYAMATAFPNEDVHDDAVDAPSGAYNVINLPPTKPLYRPKFKGARQAR